jgi:hypothetical protein
MGVALLITSCTHMPVTSMIKLARTDLVGTDPGQLRAAVKLPRAVKPQRMVLRVDVRLNDGGEEGQEFRLREVSEPRDVLVLHQELDANTHIYVYQIDPAEQGRLIAFRESLRDKQKARGGKGGSLTISVRPEACRTGELPKGPVYFTTYLRTQETDGYVPLTRDVDLRTVLPGRDLAAEIPLCA